ncbi:MAG: putative efflux rane fusion protein precursor, partial [Rhizobacter sp.]|nr:putative efflux rane fusion protein precursor [Rhizobacter sp.]
MSDGGSRMKNRAVGWTLGAVLVLAAGGGYWWTKHRQSPDGSNASQVAGAPAAGASGAGGAISVTTVKAVKRDYPVVLEANGTVAALNMVDVRPQVATVVTQVHIKEGQFVKAGQLMFSLDNRADQVNVTKAQAQLAQNQASLADAQRNLTRSTELLQQNFISQSAVDTAKTQVDAQTALVASDRAAIEAARVGLGYTRISAPSSGRAGAINVYPGSYVQPGVTT